MNKTVAIAIVAVVLVVGLVAFQPVTRNVIAQQGVCTYCHVVREYVADARLSYSVPHPPPREGKPSEEAQARCVDCHLPEGVVGTVFAYTHFASLTDLFGRFRDRNAERAAEWIPAREAAANRVRTEMQASDSVTCRGCHIESEIKPRRERGKNAHEKALKDKQTCIECHTNEKHAFSPVPETAKKESKEKAS